MPLSHGVRLGPYEILEAIGAGGMGEVYRAKDTRLDRTVAIKILPAHFSCDPVRKQRFEREAKTVSSLNHPHICVLYDVGSQDGLDYLVMECVEGETLARRLEKGPLPLEQVLKYGMQIADALDKAHRSGVVHRDLKPGNIMLTPTGAKLLDFGLAKAAGPLSTAVTLTAATPDGQWIAFFADRKLKKIPIQGGAPVTLCDVSDFPRGGSWGDDGNIVAAFNWGFSGLVRVPSGGGAPVQVTQPSKEKGETAHAWPVGRSV
jgi:serine/threonine protein kinase